MERSTRKQDTVSLKPVQFCTFLHADTLSSGGSEDVMFDLTIRQLVKNYQNKTKELERPKGSSKL